MLDKTDDNNKPLRDLLQKKNLEELDEFEKAALEGFALLETPENALELKKDLDEKMDRRLRQPGRTHQSWYWAAAVVIVAGLTILMFRNWQQPAKELAVQQPNHSTRTAPETTDDELRQPTKDSRTTPEVVKPPLSTGKKTSPTGPDPEFPGKETVTAERVPGSQKAAASQETEMTGTPLNTQQVLADSAFADRSPSLATGSPVAEKGLSVYAAAPVAANIPPSQNTKRAKMDSPASGIVNSCRYPDGDTALKAKLIRLLKPLGLDQAFEATLRVDKTGKVMDAELSDAKGLSNSQVKKIIAELKKLDGFVFTDQTGTGAPATFQFSFTP